MCNLIKGTRVKKRREYLFVVMLDTFVMFNSLENFLTSIRLLILCLLISLIIIFYFFSFSHTHMYTLTHNINMKMMNGKKLMNGNSKF